MIYFLHYVGLQSSFQEKQNKNIACYTEVPAVALQRIEILYFLLNIYSQIYHQKFIRNKQFSKQAVSPYIMRVSHCKAIGLVQNAHKKHFSN